MRLNIERERTYTKIRGIYPAEGFKCFAGWMVEGEFCHAEVPVIGWAIVSELHRDEEGELKESLEEWEDEIRLYVYEEYARPVEDLITSNGWYQVVVPGGTLDLDELMRETRSHMETEAKRQK